MGREEKHNIATLLFWEFLKSSFDILRDSLVRGEIQKLDTRS
jgi:hypothetical protein